MNATNDLLSTICKCTIPLSHVNDDGETSHIGTGILIKTERNYYLLSAKHVFENKEKTVTPDEIKKIVYCNNNYAYPIRGRYVYIPEDNIDIIICRLESQTVSDLLYHFDFIPSSHLLQGSLLRFEMAYYIVGYPQGKIKRTYPYTENSFIRSMYVIHTAGLKDNETCFQVVFHRNKMTDIKTNLRVTTPDVRGMSGSGLWYKFKDTIF